MKAKTVSRRRGVARVSVAVAGACLTGSIASAWTTARAADFETEFEGGEGLSADAPAAPASPGIAAEQIATVWEQTLVGYLEKLVTRECEECEKAAAKQDEVVAQAHAGQKDAEETVEVKQDANPDWDIDEPATAVVAIDADWDLEEAPVVVADADADWDLDEAPVVVTNADADWDLIEAAVIVADADTDWDLEEYSPVVAKVDPDWDLEEPATVAAASPDWDIEEPDGEAVAAAAAQDGDAPPEIADDNPDWDLEDSTVAAVSPEVKLESEVDVLDLFP